MFHYKREAVVHCRKDAVINAIERTSFYAGAFTYQVSIDSLQYFSLEPQSKFGAGWNTAIPRASISVDDGSKGTLIQAQFSLPGGGFAAAFLMLAFGTIATAYFAADALINHMPVSAAFLIPIVGAALIVSGLRSVFRYYADEVWAQLIGALGTGDGFHDPK